MSVDDQWDDDLVESGVATLALGYGGGYFVAVGLDGTHGVAENPDGPWTELDTAVAPDDLYGLEYADGRWVAVGGEAAPSALILTTTDPTATWTTPSSVPDIGLLYDAAHHDGRWVVSGIGKVLTTTDATGTWTQVSVGDPSDAHYAVAYGGGYWVIASGGGIYYATDPTGSWTREDFGGIAIDLDYGDGRWLVVGRSVGAGPTYTALAKTVTVPSGTWTSASPGGTYTQGYKVCRFLDDIWIVGGNNTDPEDATTLRVADAIAGPWSSATLPAGNTYPYVATDGNNWVAYVGTEGNLSTTVAVQSGGGAGWGMVL